MIQIKEFLQYIEKKNPNEPEFLQAVTEVVESIKDFLDQNPIYEKEKILERITEPERTIMFRIPWMDDKGEIHVNK